MQSKCVKLFRKCVVCYDEWSLRETYRKAIEKQISFPFPTHPFVVITNLNKMCIWKLSFFCVFCPVFGSEEFNCDLGTSAVISFLSDFICFSQMETHALPGLLRQLLPCDWWRSTFMFAYLWLMPPILHDIKGRQHWLASWFEARVLHAWLGREHCTYSIFFLSLCVCWAGDPILPLASSHMEKVA